jgi:hypothetical protein
MALSALNLSLAGARLPRDLITENTKFIAEDLDLLLDLGEIGCDCPRTALLAPVDLLYASIDHLMLLDQLAVHIKDRRVLNLVSQYLRRSACTGFAHKAEMPSR